MLTHRLNCLGGDAARRCAPTCVNHSRSESFSVHQDDKIRGQSAEKTTSDCPLCRGDAGRPLCRFPELCEDGCRLVGPPSAGVPIHRDYEGRAVKRADLLVGSGAFPDLAASTAAGRFSTVIGLATFPAEPIASVVLRHRIVLSFVLACNEIHRTAGRLLRPACRQVCIPE